MPQRIVVVGGGAAGIGAAGAAKGTDPDADVIVYTEYEDAAYSPCGIPYVHGQEIPDFERLFLGTKQQYADQGIDIRYETAVERIDTAARTVTRRRARPCPTTPWSSPPGGTTAARRPRRRPRRPLLRQEHPRGDGVGQDPRRRQERGRARGRPARRWRWSRRSRHRGIETHLVDPSPWACRWRPTRHRQAGRGLLGRDGRAPALQHQARGVPGRRGRRGPRRADLRRRDRRQLVVDRHPQGAQHRARRGCRAESASTGGFIVDERMRPRSTGVWAAGDCVEVPHGVTNVPVQGLSGSHAYARARSPASTPPAGGGPTSRSTSPGGWSPGSG